MHTKPMKDSDGGFGEWKQSPVKECLISDGCGNPDVWFRSWDSHCGGYTDYKLECRNCGREKWVEGPDA